MTELCFGFLSTITSVHPQPFCLLQEPDLDLSRCMLRQIRYGKKRRHCSVLFAMKQCLQFQFQDLIIDLFPAEVLLFRQIIQSEMREDRSHNLTFNFQIIGQVYLHRANNIRNISLAGIMEQTGELLPLRPPSGFRFRSTVERMLSHRIKIGQLSTAPAQ